MNTKHTPGPWHTGGNENRIIYAEDGFAVADATVFHGRHEGKHKANARLIAAAPESTACNRIALTWLEHPAVHDAFRNDEALYPRLKEAIEMHRAAIAKATGND